MEAKESLGEVIEDLKKKQIEQKNYKKNFSADRERISYEGIFNEEKKEVIESF